MPQDEFGSSFKSQWETYIERISVPPGNVERCSHGHTPPGSVDCSSFFSTDSTGRNASALALQAQYAAWRPYYTASLRRALGPHKTLMANVLTANEPAVSDASLNGVAIEFEHCGKQADGLEDGLNVACRMALLAQKAVTDQARLPAVFALWLTHSELVSAAEQCSQLAQVRAAMPWVSEGDDLRDCTEERGPASCVRCNATSTSSI